MLLYSQEQMYNPQAAARHYPSPHHSPSMDLGKPVPAHHHHQHEQHQRWGGWEYAPKQQRLPPSPPMHPHIHHAYAAAATSAYGHPDEDYHHQQQQQQMPMTPPTSEGFMSPDLGGQQWMLQSTTPPPSLSSSAGLFPDLQQQQRKKRRLTEPAEANYHCGLCGKYFSRVWNYNAHRETHDPSRAKPHACRADGCGKAFVRRTDLARHVQCVHEKDKKFKCALCNNRFARKDTLRRHEDDGCPKRIDIQSRHNHPSKNNNSNNPLLHHGASQNNNISSSNSSSSSSSSSSSNPNSSMHQHHHAQSAPIAWTSWALRCPPPPPEYFVGFDGEQQVMSHLPPLGVARQ